MSALRMGFYTGGALNALHLSPVFNVWENCARTDKSLTLSAFGVGNARLPKIHRIPTTETELSNFDHTAGLQVPAGNRHALQDNSRRYQPSQ